MRIDRGMINTKVEGLCDLSRVEKAVNKKAKTKKNRKKPKRAMLKRLYEACTRSFFGPGTVPSLPNVQLLQSILDDMKPSDLGLREDMPSFKVTDKELSPITCMPIYGCDKFSICIFCLPPGAVIPLHNHPDMTVFSKLLFGSMHIKSYDWVTDAKAGDHADVKMNKETGAGPRLAKVHFDGILTAQCDTSILYPTTGGNLHSFRALTACAILDVFGPPYSDSEGRDCTYYRSLPLPQTPVIPPGEDVVACSGGVYEVLEEMKQPDDIFLPAVYKGPGIK